MVYWLGRETHNAPMTPIALLSEVLAQPPPNLGQATQTTDTFEQFLEQIGLSKPVAAEKGALTIVVLALALVVSRYLVRRASRVPVPLDGRFVIRRKGGVVEREGGSSLLVGRITGFCIWFAALVAIAFIWFTSLNLDTKTRDALLHQLGGFGAQLGASLVILACTLVIGRVLQKSLVAGLSRSRLNANLKLLAGRILYIGTLVVGVVVILAIWSASIVLPVALLGALGVALSLALQDVLRNLVAGIYLLIEHPFVIGDRIAVSTYTGRIEDIQIRYTALRTDEDELVLMPNSMLFSSAVVNLSDADRKRCSLTVSVPTQTGADLDYIEGQIRGALRGVRSVLLDPEPQILLNKASNGTMAIQVTFWISREDFGQSASIYAEVMEQIRMQVQDAEISVLDSAATAVV